MPLDSTTWKPKTETKPDLSKPSLAGLSWLLRHMPETHHWDFGFIGGLLPHYYISGRCGSAGCALGLAKATWKIGDIWGVWGVPLPVATRFFNRYAYQCDYTRVTPVMVADRIDAYLAETRK